MFRSWGEALLDSACAIAGYSRWIASLLATSLILASAPSRNPCALTTVRFNSVSELMSTRRAGATMPSFIQFNISVPPAIAIAPGTSRALSASSSVDGRSSMKLRMRYTLPAALARTAATRDLVLSRHGTEHETRQHAASVHVHSARTAFATIASPLRACQPELLSESIE
jgi:hypothetical protein